MTRNKKLGGRLDYLALESTHINEAESILQSTSALKLVKIPLSENGTLKATPMRVKIFFIS